MTIAQPDPQALKPANPVNLDYVQALPESKRVALLAILTRSDFQDCPTFRSQIAFIRDTLGQYPTVEITHRELAGSLSCGHGSICNQLQRLSETVKANGRPRLLPTDTLQMIIDPITESYRKFNPCMIDYLLDRIERLADLSVSPDTMWHLLQKMPQIKIVDGIPMEKTRVRASLQAIRE
jgi:hypothetical protein